MTHFPVYIYQQKDWPHFRWDQSQVNELLLKARYHQGLLLGRMKTLGFERRNESNLETLIQDVLKSSEIEGEILDIQQVRSSVARHLGLELAGLPEPNREVEGVVSMLLDATQSFNKPLTAKRLFSWHTDLFPYGNSRLIPIRTGAWRDDKSSPMRVISGPIGRERIHFEAPPAHMLDKEMKQFLVWYNSKESLDLILKAAIAHLWFVTIHPFADGNGRIARAIADMTLARSENNSNRYYSMSAQIRKERKDYYIHLEHTQKDSLDITRWLIWFLNCFMAAVESSEKTLTKVITKTQYWEHIAGTSLNERQIKMINILIDGLSGHLTSSKWAKITKCSQDTAYRDILDLIDKGVLMKNPGEGRSTSYSLVPLCP